MDKPTSVVIGYCPNCNDVHVILMKDDIQMVEFILNDEMYKNITEVREEMKRRKKGLTQ